MNFAQLKAQTDIFHMDHTENYIRVSFSKPWAVLSSAILNGGFTHANHIVNLKVPKVSKPTLAPHKTIQRYCQDAGWAPPIVGMMTAASMKSLRLTTYKQDDFELHVMVTSGLSNPRRAGDHAEYRLLTSSEYTAGTINMIILCSMNMQNNTMVETIMTATEAKVAVMHDLGILSPVSNKLATGTGTDAVALCCGNGSKTIQYSGKHTLFGEIVGKLVTEAVASSLAWDLKICHPVDQGNL